MKSKKDLVVIIICIVFLLANIAAIGPGGRRRAREALCLSRLMTWGQVFQSYTADNNGYFHMRTIGSQAGYNKMWHRTYEPYYSDRIMLCCPAAENPDCDLGTFGTWGGTNWDGGVFGSWSTGGYYGSYGFNRYVIDMRLVTGEEKYWRRAGYKDASNVPVLLDCMYVNLFYHESENMDIPQYDGHFAGHSIQLSCINRHDGGVNVCFMDFSARKVGLKELWTLKGHRQFDTCNSWTICGNGGDEQACADKWDDAAPWMSDFPEY